MTKPEFSELEADATIELINQGVGRASDALAKLIQEEVVLSVPNVLFVDFPSLERQLRKIDDNRPLVVVTQHYQGDFSGDALLAFPERCGELLVKQMLEEMTIEIDSSDLQQDALLEMGNIILNACFGQLGDLLDTEFECAFPRFMNASVDETLHQLEKLFSQLSENRVAMLLQVDFMVQSIALQGYLGFIMDDASMSMFQNKIKSYLKALFN